MYEATREQESKVAELALEHGAVAEVEVGEYVVKATAGGVNWLITADGRAEKAPPAYAVVNIPTEILRGLLGPEYVDGVLGGVDENDAFPEHTLGRNVRDRLLETLATRVERKVRWA